VPVLRVSRLDDQIVERFREEPVVDFEVIEHCRK
jgi:hypothetical protein